MFTATGTAAMMHRSPQKKKTARLHSLSCAGPLARPCPAAAAVAAGARASGAATAQGMHATL